ncbi:hypothetical protein [Streptomyces sp. NPDC058240]|uniref:hypothetical protein n=1 Tax=Streptomyces sp. NPDC058240 TaxID=3346396 RepID=UPI0036E7559E
MTDWDRLIRLNGGEKIVYESPALDTPAEVWFYAPAWELRLWSAGGLVVHDTDAVTVADPVTARSTLYRLRDQLVVDVEVRSDTAVVRRGVLNGPLVASRIAPGDVAALLADYRALGFRDGAPWNATETRVTVREYRRDGTAWTIRVDGEHTLENGQRVSTAGADRQAAIACAERLVRGKEEDGFSLHLIETFPAQHPNPRPVPPADVVLSATVPTAAPVPVPPDAFAAVDAAVSILTDLHRRIPTAHFVTELLDVPQDQARVEESEGHANFFLDMHAKRVGRWRSAQPGTPRADESSWDYFARIYASITWVLHSEACAGLDMFYCGNVSGGGWSCLEIDSAGTYDTDDHADAVDNPELAELFVFHGGWHYDQSFAFDQRVCSPSGEHPVVPFSDTLECLPPPALPSTVEPFGMWLYHRVSDLAEQAERNLCELL